MARHSTTTHALLESARYEVLPTEGIAESVLAHVPAEVTVTVTASEHQGLEATLVVCEKLAAAGRRAVPHIAARLVRDRHQLHAIIDRVAEAGIRDIFVPGGDATPPAGTYTNALELLQDIRELEAPVDQIGIAAYPEPHPQIAADPLAQALWDKQGYATYMVSNLCFDAETIMRWLYGVRAEGVELPLRIGVPGKVELARLARVATKIGVGESAKFLMKNPSTFARMATPGGYNPQRLLDSLATLLDSSAEGLPGLHVYTFNQLQATEQWRTRKLARV